MSFTNRVSQRLHEEHRATVALMERLEQLLARQRHGGAPDNGDPAVSLLLSELSASLETEVRRHFDFEEDQLFTYLNGTGDEAIGALLTDEHRVIRPLGAEVAELAREAAAQGFDEARWSKFRRRGPGALPTASGARRKGRDGTFAPASGRHGCRYRSSPA